MKPSDRKSEPTTLEGAVLAIWDEYMLDDECDYIKINGLIELAHELVTGRQAPQTAMVERVTNAIAAVEIPADTPVPIYEWYARAAIAAMREPTDAMIAALADAKTALDVWPDMIDAALSESKA